MTPKSGKSVRLFNPLAIWTNFALKSGEAMLDAAQAAIARRTPKVGVIHAADAPAPKARRPKATKARSKKRNAKRARR